MFTDELVTELLTFSYSKLLDAIIKIHPSINTHINILSLIPFFNCYGIFTNDEIQYFNSDYQGDKQKVNKLIESLKTKHEEGVYNFVRALNDGCEHNGHLTILEHLRAK